MIILDLTELLHRRSILLWDINTKTLDKSKHWKFIIERIVEYGDIDETSWMDKNFTREKLLTRFKTSEVLNTIAHYRFLKMFYLARGKTLSLQLGHRKTIDKIDWRIIKRFHINEAKKNFNNLQSSYLG